MAFATTAARFRPAITLAIAILLGFATLLASSSAPGTTRLAHSASGADLPIELKGIVGGAVTALDHHEGRLAVGVGTRIHLFGVGADGHLAPLAEYAASAVVADIALTADRLVVVDVNGRVWVGAPDSAGAMDGFIEVLTATGGSIGAHQVVASEGYAFLAAGSSLHTVDIEDARLPRIAAQADVHHAVVPGAQLALRGGFIAISAGRVSSSEGRRGLGWIDVRDPLRPALVAWDESVEAHAVGVGNRYVAAYAPLADGEFEPGIQLFHLDEDRLWELATNTPIDDQVLAMRFFGADQLLARTAGQLRRYRVGAAATLTLESEIDLPHDRLLGLGVPSQRLRQMSVNGDRIYLTFNGGADARILDSGVLVVRLLPDGGFQHEEDEGWHHPFPVSVSHVTVTGNILAVGEEGTTSMVRLYERGDGAQLEPLGTAPIDIGINSIAADGRWLFIVDTNPVVYAIDIHDPRSPVVVDSMALDGAKTITAGKERLFVERIVTTPEEGTRRDLEVYRIDELGNLIRTSAQVICLGTIREMEVVDDELLVACYQDGFVRASLRDPDRPQVIDRAPIDARARGVAATDGAVLVATRWPTREEDRELRHPPVYGGLRVLDRVDLRELGAYRVPVARDGDWDVAVIGNLALFTSDYTRIRVVDVANPAAPREVVTMEMPTRVSRLEVIGNTAYFAGGTGGLGVLHVESAGDPRGQLLFLPMGLVRR